MEHKIISYLEKFPNSKARVIAKAFGIEKSKINSLLYGKLKNKVQSNKQYEWSLKKSTINKSVKNTKDIKIETKASEESKDNFSNTSLNETDEVNNQSKKEFKKKTISTNKNKKTPLAKNSNHNEDINRLAKYYLSCLGYDYDETSVWASNKNGDLDYIELTENNYNDEEDMEDNWVLSDLSNSVSKDRLGRKKLNYGYPVNLKKITSQKGTFYKVEPLFLFDIHKTNDNFYQIDKESISVNSSIKELFANGEVEKSSLMNEIATLEDDLGIADKDIPDLSDIVDKLKAIKSDWPWREDMNLDSLNSEPPLSETFEPGIYNRAIVVKSDKSTITRGLESELKRLSEVSNKDLEKSVLYKMINNLPNDDADEEIRDILAPIPMNLEQENAVRTSMNKAITVITGPPGTGKSQVVTNLLINLARNNKRVLFASKNNKAVDVVEIRVNSLGSRPILLRHGSGQYQTKMLEYVIALLTSECTDNDKRNYEKLLYQHKTYTSAKNKIEDELNEIIKTRNYVDDLEQSVEIYRSEMTNNDFLGLKNFDANLIKPLVNEILGHLKDVEKKDSNILKKILWIFNKKNIIEKIRNSLMKLDDKIEKLPLSKKPLFENEKNAQSLKDYLLNELNKSIEEYSRISSYLTGLDKLSSLSELSDVYSRFEKANLLLEKESLNLWKLWLKIQVGDQVEDRKALADYQTSLKMSNESELNLDRNYDLKKKINECKKKYSSKIPCWAITSLSAKGRIDFDAGIFDVVVFDEASQCDIASALPLLYRAKTAVVIGDPKQLTHISSLPRKQDIRLLGKHDLSDKFISWAYSFNSLYDLMSGYIDDSLINLLDHHRSHKDIINFSNTQFYEDKLRIATNYDYLNLPEKEVTGIRWVDVNGKTRRHNQGGSINEIEARAVVKEIERLVITNNYIGTVGVVTPFRQQASMIREMTMSNKMLSERLVKQDFLVDTAHRFQGDEKDVMIFSPVYSDGIASGSISFLQNQGNIFNVAITRARAQLIVVGDLNMCSNSDIGYLKNFAQYTQSLSNEYIDTSQDIINNDAGEEYPKVQNPESVSDWEVLFYKALYRKGIKTIPQYPLEKYKLDLAIIDGERKLDIEVDGVRYHQNWDGELCRRDMIRNSRVQELGWDVKRFWVYQIRDDLENCILEIENWINK